MTTLRAGDFDSLTSLQALYFDGSQLTALPDGAFDGLTGLLTLDLRGSRLVGLTPNAPLFAGLPDAIVLYLDGQTEPPEQPTKKWPRKFEQHVKV